MVISQYFIRRLYWCWFDKHSTRNEERNRI